MLLLSWYPWYPEKVIDVNAGLHVTVLEVERLRIEQ